MSVEHQAKEEANKALLRTVMEAIDRRDTETVSAFMSEDMVHENPFSGSHRGIADVNQARLQTFSRLGFSRVEVRTIFAEGPTDVLALLDIHGTDAAGEPWTMPAANLFKIVDGKIV